MEALVHCILRLQGVVILRTEEAFRVGEQHSRLYQGAFAARHREHHRQPPRYRCGHQLTVRSKTYSSSTWAKTIPPSILILAAAVFRDSAEATSSLFDAADLIRSTLGHGTYPRAFHSCFPDPLAVGLEIVFALALLSAGQSASLVATVAGQIVSEGFLRWKVSVSTIHSTPSSLS